MSDPRIQKVLAVAKKYVDEGYTETGDNQTIFGKWYGLQGQPWCAMYVSFCFSEAGAIDLIQAQSKKGFAGCNQAVAFFAKKGMLVPVGDAQPGDIVFFDFDDNPKTSEHVGLVYVNQPLLKNLVTFEGNTSTAGSQANGGGCFKKKRPYSKVVAVVRPWN